jgi:MarR family 2-MHQ and catechol resistance regulon transcriptional repressor
MIRPAKVHGESSALHVWVVLYKAAHAIEQNALRSLSGMKLGLSEFAVLEELLHRGPQPVNAIGKKILLASASITAAIQRLEGRGLVRRAQNPDDLRASIVQLTAAGRRLIEKAIEQHAAEMEEVMGVLPKAERLELVRILKKLGLSAATKLESAD